MAFVKRFVFEHLSQQHMERLQRMREELEYTLALPHQLERGQLNPTLKDYWRITEREKNLLRQETGTQHWQRK